MASRTSRIPKERIYVTEGEERFKPSVKQLVCYWVFGPDTKTPWPGGDFYSHGWCVAPSAWSLESLLQRKDISIYDPDLVVDTDL